MPKPKIKNRPTVIILRSLRDDEHAAWKAAKAATDDENAAAVRAKLEENEQLEAQMQVPMRLTIDNWREIGRRLLVVEDRLPANEYKKWLETEKLNTGPARHSSVRSDAKWLARYWVQVHEWLALKAFKAPVSHHPVYFREAMRRMDCPYAKGRVEDEWDQDADLARRYRRAWLRARERRKEMQRWVRWSKKQPMQSYTNEHGDTVIGKRPKPPTPRLAIELATWLEEIEGLTNKQSSLANEMRRRGRASKRDVSTLRARAKKVLASIERIHAFLGTGDAIQVAIS